MLNVSGSFDLRIIPASIDLKQTQAEINFYRPDPDIQLDFKDNRASIGYEESLPFQLDFSQKALQTVQRGIERRVREGEMIKAREKHTGFADLARERENSEIGTATMDYIQPVRVSVKTENVEYSAQVGGVSVSYSPGVVHVITPQFDVKV